jgi:pimeloyl-ACP methyl ester carboxylesterase
MGQIPGRVILIPGMAGSSLSAKTPGNIEIDIWLNYIRAAGPLLELLRLDSTGLAPAHPSLVSSVSAIGALDAYYGPALAFFSSQGSTQIFSYDWRLPIEQASAALASFLAQLLPGGPVYLVCHSMGGLVAREAESSLRTNPSYGNLKRIITVATPQYGSFEAVKTLASIPSWLDPYAKWLGRCGYKRTYDLAVSYLVHFLSCFRTTYQLLPDAWNGPFAPIPSTAQLYNVVTWNGVNGDVSTLFLSAAQAFKQSLPSPPDNGLFITVTGVGQQTANGVVDISDLSNPNSYSYDLNGDGVVPLVSSQLMDAYGIYATADHQSLMQRSDVLATIASVLVPGLNHDLVL